MDKLELLEELKKKPKNVRYERLCGIVEAFGFRFRGGRGSHRVYVKDGVKEILNFQDVGGKAKPYQVRQFIKLSKNTISKRIKLMYKYAIEIFYSEEDEGYIAVVPELSGCTAFGETEEEALKEVKIAVVLWLETAKNEGRTIPQPQKRELIAAF